MRYATYAEYLRLPEFRAIVAAVHERSGGTCEQCRSAAATEPHHVRYCRWGDVDTAENLIHLCHACHEAAHRCQSCGRVALKARQIKEGSDVCQSCDGSANGNLP